MACPIPQGGHNKNAIGRLQNELYVDKQRSSVGHAIENELPDTYVRGASATRRAAQFCTSP